MKIDYDKTINQYKFCYKCGGQLQKAGFNNLTCTSCGYRFFVNPAPTTGAILENKNGEILLVRRRVEPKAGYWDSPGGFVDIGETAEEGMKRELKEELGVEIDDLKYFGTMVDTYLWDGIEIIGLGLAFTGKIGDVEITPSDDVDGYQFFKKDEIPYDKIAFEGLKGLLKKMYPNE